MPVLPEYNLAEKVALLHTSGGNEAPLLAQVLAEAGASVFVVGRTTALLESVLAALGKGHHAGVVSSLGTTADVGEVLTALERHYQRADILVNDTRSFFASPLAEISLEEWDELQSRNLRSAFMLCQAVSQEMVRQKYGRIVNLVSVMAERGVINGSAFAATQAGLLSLTRSLAVELGRHNIRVNALGTGWTTAEDIPSEIQQEELLVRYTPLHRRGHPRDIGPLLVYLCSAACEYATGQPVYVDGGLNAHP